MENKATDHFNPTWDKRPREHGDREQAMGQDALPTTHPIQQVIRDESEANSAFDGISYQKGGQVLRMIEDWIGPDVFRAGLRRYMKAHAYSNATSADLWAALGAASGRDVAGVARGFTEQPGVPLVKVERSCQGGKATITLSQDRFTIHDPHPKAETWMIPVTVGGPGLPARRLLLGAEPKTLPIAGCAAPVKVNWGENGYYRTQYDEPSLAALAKVLPRLPAADRADVLGDQYALFQAERAPLAAYLALLPALKGERDIAVWEEIIGRLRGIDIALIGTPERARFDAFAVGLIQPAFARLGWDAQPGERFLDSELRPELIAALGQLGAPAVIAEARRRFQAFAAGHGALPPESRSAVLSVLSHDVDRPTWETLKALGVKATATEDKLRYFSAMAGADDPELIKANVAFSYSGEIPNGRITQFLAEASRESGKTGQLYDLVAAHETDYAKRLVGDGLDLTALQAAASGSADPALADRILAAPSSNASNGARVAAARIADSIRTRAALRARIAASVQAWLASGAH
jgi:aminopeptidase N